MSGNSEDGDKVRQEMNEWLLVGDGAVQKVVVLLWRLEEEKLMDFVIEVYAYNKNIKGMVTKISKSVRKASPMLTDSNTDSKVLVRRKSRLVD